MFNTSNDWCVCSLRVWPCNNLCSGCTPPLQENLVAVSIFFFFQIRFYAFVTLMSLRNLQFDSTGEFRALSFWPLTGTAVSCHYKSATFIVHVDARCSTSNFYFHTSNGTMILRKISNSFGICWCWTQTCWVQHLFFTPTKDPNPWAAFPISRIFFGQTFLGLCNFQSSPLYIKCTRKLQSSETVICCLPLKKTFFF